MRVLHVVTAFPRHEGDPITPWMVEILRGLRRRGIGAEVLAPAYRGGGGTEVHGIPVRRFRYAPGPIETLTHDETVPDRIRSSKGHAALVPLYLAAGTAAAAREGSVGEWDVVHVHWPMPHALMGAALRSASRGRTALVSSYYSVELRWVERRMPWLRPFLAWSARTSDALTANSSATAARVGDYTDREVHVVPAPAPFDEDAAGREGAPPAFSGEGPLRLLFVGRLVERKGVEHLVRALPRILEERDAVVTIVGEGRWRSRIARAARDAGVEERVRFTGYVSSDRLRRLYAECDAFVLPAVYDEKGDTEGLGVVLLEALLFERPVIASGIGGIVDIVKPGVTGWTVPPGDPDALAEAVLEAAGDPGRARSIAARGRRHVLENFSTSAVVDALEEVYAAAVERRRGGEA